MSTPHASGWYWSRVCDCECCRGEESFGQGITSDVLAPAEVPGLNDLIAALRAVPALKVAAGEVLYQSLTNRAGVASLRSAALELRAVLEQHLGADE
jgi:hypothetical protein